MSLGKIKKVKSGRNLHLSNFQRILGQPGLCGRSGKIDLLFSHKNTHVLSDQPSLFTSIVEVSVKDSISLLFKGQHTIFESSF